MTNYEKAISELVFIQNNSKSIIFLKSMTTQQNKQAFINIEYHWSSVRLDFLRPIEPNIKAEIERIYKEEIDAGWNPNYFCGNCFLKAIKELIKHFEL